MTSPIQSHLCVGPSCWICGEPAEIRQLRQYEVLSALHRLAQDHPGADHHRQARAAMDALRPTLMRWLHAEADLREQGAALDLATEFRIPCPVPADPGRPDSAPVLRPDPLIIRKNTGNWSDQWPDGWMILNPNLQPGDQVWTGERWEYRGQVYGGVIYQWTRDQAIALGRDLAVEEARRYETWLADMRAGREG